MSGLKPYIKLKGSDPDAIIGNICYFKEDREGWVVADGSIFNISDYPEAFKVLGNRYGGDGIDTFGVPDILYYSMKPHVYESVRALLKYINENDG